MTLMQPVPKPGDDGASATHDAHALIPNGVKAEIVLNDQTYVLRITRAGKLILTK